MYYMTHTEDFVKEMYTKINILKPLELDFRHIAARLGIKVFYWTESSQAVFNNELSYILLNENLSIPEQWQDFGHELCHVLLHTGNQNYLTQSFREYQEAKANYFMYHACVPSFMLMEIDAASLSAQYIARHFNVVEDFARRRLEMFMNKKMFHEHLSIVN